jgi:DNA-binding NarL/FixJ family response regulator
MEEKSRIMVVDDDRTLLDMAEEVFSEDYDVTLVVSGKQALEILKSDVPPDLILLDIDMPGMDGYETFEHIHNTKGLPEIPVVFLTGLTGSDAELTGLSLGAQDYIPKPFIRENLLARIRLRLESGRQARQLQIMKEKLRETGIDEERFTALTWELTSTEQAVARLITLGYSNQEIASRLNYSQGYIKNLATLIYDKLGVSSRRKLHAIFRN